MRDALLVAAGGAVGSVLRWWLSAAIHRAAGVPFPWGTLAVNVIGSFVVGYVGLLGAERVLGTHAARLFVIVGLLGGFTTFSAFSWESVMLLRDGRWVWALGYVAVSVVAGLGAAIGGLALASR